MFKWLNYDVKTHLKKNNTGKGQYFDNYWYPFIMLSSCSVIKKLET